jgi:hypothetical protein
MLLHSQDVRKEIPTYIVCPDDLELRIDLQKHEADEIEVLHVTHVLQHHQGCGFGSSATSF